MELSEFQLRWTQIEIKGLGQKDRQTYRQRGQFSKHKPDGTTHRKSWSRAGRENIESFSGYLKPYSDGGTDRTDMLSSKLLNVYIEIVFLFILFYWAMNIKKIELFIFQLLFFPVVQHYIEVNEVELMGHLRSFLFYLFRKAKTLKWQWERVKLNEKSRSGKWVLES